MEKIKLPRSSYDELTKIISAYGVRNKPAGLSDIEQATGVNRTVVSANNAFLTFLQIIEGGNKKNSTEKGTILARALEHRIEEEIESAWSQIVVDNDFLSTMIQALKIRRGMEASQFENHIAYSSGEVKSRGVMTGARAVVDLLLHSGMVKQDGDKLTATETSPIDSVTVENRPSENVTNIVVKNEGVSTGTLSVSLTIDLSITAKPDELEGLGTKIKSFLEELRDAE